MRFGRARREELVPNGTVAVSNPGYWEHRLRLVGGRIDSTGVDLKGLAVSVTGGEAWVSGFVHDAIRFNLGPQPASFRVEGAGVDLPVQRGADGPWATRLRAVGWSLDRDHEAAREPCIIHQDPGFLVTARVNDGREWTTVSWSLSETGTIQ
jgi:hypothetical protein